MAVYRKDAIGGGLVRGLCVDGTRLDAGPCACGCVVCCGEGNQCAVYAVRNAQAVATLDGCLNGPGIRFVPWNSAIDGWTGLGRGFDIACRVDRRERLTEGPNGFDEIQDFTWTDRFRLASATATPEQLAELLGEPANPAGWVLVGLLKTYEGPTDLVGQVCTGLFVDSGPITGRYRLLSTTEGINEDLTIDSFLDYTRGGVLPEADPFFRPRAVPAWRPTTAIFVQPNFGQPFSPLLCDGLTWQPWDLHPLGAAGMPDALTDAFGPVAGISPGIYPFNTPAPPTPPPTPAQACQTAIDRLVLARVGGASETGFTLDCGSVQNPGTHTASFEVEHGLAARFTLRRSVLTRNCIDEPYTDTLDTVVEADVTVVETCPGALTLEPISCTPDQLLLRLAMPCSVFDADPIPYDPETRPADGVTLIFNGRRFEPTTIPTLGKPVGDWSSVPCQDVRLGVPCDPGAGLEPYPYLSTDAPAGTTAFRVGDDTYRQTETPTSLLPQPVDQWLSGCPSFQKIARRCRQIGSAAQDPLEIPYTVDFAIGAGNGSVALVTRDDPFTGCVRVTYYRPTAEDWDPDRPGVDGTVTNQVDEPACQRGDQQWCQGDPGEPPVPYPNQAAPRGGSNPAFTPLVTGTSGAGTVAFDPMAAQVAYFGCRGCGDPGV